MKTDNGWICDYCGVLQSDYTTLFCRGHQSLLKLSIVGQIGNFAPVEINEKSIHIMAECILRGYVVSSTDLRQWVRGGPYLQWAGAYDSAITWIVRDGGRQVLDTVVSRRLGLVTQA